MKTKFTILAIIFLLGLAGIFYLHQAQGEPPHREELNTSGDKKSTEPSYHPELSLQALGQMEFNGRDLQLGRVLDNNSAYTRYYVEYKSGGLTISGIMNVPKGDGPFPVLILNHGYIDPAIYTNGRGLKREQDYFARRGYVVIHPDYRNHAFSSDTVHEDKRFRFGYAEDVINAIYAVQESELEFFDKDNIGMLGHSMGGGVALKIMTSNPNLVDAVSLYAPVSSVAWDNFQQWTVDREEIAQEILDTRGTPEENPEFWANISPINFLDKTKAPVILHHGTADADVPIAWSDKLDKAMENEGKVITYYIYEGGPHEFINEWPLFMQRNLEFFNEHLKN
ncbi:MAG: alpha/beta fold hydrolase [Candidatus Spechtbacterales bacterium]|nr:alpha/beta fold hydrolase [Candidatus Spechtbacterales bacterium]